MSDMSQSISLAPDEPRDQMPLPDPPRAELIAPLPYTVVYERAQPTDSEMLDWLCRHLREVPLSPAQYTHADAPDTRLHYSFDDVPVLMSWADYCGQISLREAIALAMKDRL